jgi:type IV secretion system protein VirD4
LIPSSRYFSRSDRLKRQLVIRAGFDPIILQRVEYFDTEAVHARVFRGVAESA